MEYTESAQDVGWTFVHLPNCVSSSGHGILKGIAYFIPQSFSDTTMKVRVRKSNKPEGWLDSGWKVPVHLNVK